MGKLNFFKGMLRANQKTYGDLEGEITGLKAGKLCVSVIQNQCVAWIVNQEDMVLSKENVASLEKLSTNVLVGDFPYSKGAKVFVDVYRITLKDGKSGTLRLEAASAYKIITLLQ